MASVPRIKGKERYSLISSLATLLTAGIPILESVEGLLEESKGNVRRVLVVLRNALSEGQTLSYGMQKMPHNFDPITVNLVRAAEEAGSLEKTLKDLAVTIKKQMAFTDKLIGSLAYPAFVLVVFGGVLTFILIFVIPRLGRVFLGLGQVPPTTRFLIWASEILLAYYPYIIAGMIALAIGVIILFRLKRRMLINAFLSLPGLRHLGREIDLANFTRSMGLLLSAGIPIAEALKFSQNVVVKKEVLRIVQKMSQSVDTGRPLSTDLKKARNIIPSTTLRIIETAEASGNLENAMKELSDFFETRISRTLKTLTTLLEPVLLVVMGIMVGGMMISIIAPIYSLISNINK